MFAEGSFDVPPTRFMEKIKAVVSEEDFQHIRKEILKALKGEKNYICSCNCTEEKNQVRQGLKQLIIEARQEHGSLEDKMVTLDERYQALASLELELMDIRNRKNIIAHEDSKNRKH